MIVRILTDRSKKYAVLEELYGPAAEFRYSSVDEMMTDPDQGREDIVVADPELDDLDGVAGSLLKKRLITGKTFIICGPERIRGLVRELKAAGLETRDTDNAEEPLMMAEGTEPVNDIYRREGLKKTQIPVLRLCIGLVELSDGAGAGFLTLLLAEELASESFQDGKLVTVFAPDDPYYSRALSLEKRFGPEDFQDIIIQTGREDLVSTEIRAAVNIDEGISWAVGSGSGPNRQSIDLKTKLEALERTEGNYILCPFHFPEIGNRLPLLKESLDALIVVTDPRPSSVLSGMDRLEQLRDSGIPLIYVVSHTNAAVKRNDIFDSLETEDAVFIPDVDPAAVIEAEYSGQNPYRIDGIRKLTMAPVCGIIDRLKHYCF